ncbi:unnamed protein product [Chrysoparadoxa australica]
MHIVLPSTPHRLPSPPPSQLCFLPPTLSTLPLTGCRQAGKLSDEDLALLDERMAEANAEVEAFIKAKKETAEAGRRADRALLQQKQRASIAEMQGRLQEIEVEEEALQARLAELKVGHSPTCLLPYFWFLFLTLFVLYPTNRSEKRPWG